MSEDSTTVDDAARSLSEIATVQGSLIDKMLLPTPYWWLVAALTIGLGATVDTHRHVLIACATVAYALVVAAATVWVTLGRTRAQLSRQLLGERGALAIVTFVLSSVGISLGVGFGAQAAGVAHPALIACGLCAIGLVVGGPILNRHLRRTMMHNRARVAQ